PTSPATLAIPLQTSPMVETTLEPPPPEGCCSICCSCASSACSSRRRSAFFSARSFASFFLRASSSALRRSSTFLLLASYSARLPAELSLKWYSAVQSILPANSAKSSLRIPLCPWLLH